MIRHTILFKTKRNVSSEEVNAAIKQFLNLKNHLSGIITILGGACHFNEHGIQLKADDIFTHSISIDFDNQNDLNNFFINPVTHPAKAASLDITEQGYQGIIGFEIVTS